MADDQERLVVALREFAAERDWEQFHAPKNLVMALSGEVGELAALFQWLTGEESQRVMDGPAASDVRDELADVYGYLLRLADVLGVDLNAALESKMAANALRYSVDRAKGNAEKFSR